MKKIVLSLLAMAMMEAGPCLGFDFPGHEGQIPFCQNNKTGALRFVQVKDIDPSTNVDYEPHCNTRTETLIWVNIQGPYVSTVLVSPVGNATENGVALLSALNGITASNTNRVLLKIEPGIYDIGMQSFQMKEYVDVEGSGEKVTEITAALSCGSLPPTAGTVNGASNAEIRSLTIKNAGTGQITVAFCNFSASPAMTHITVAASGGTDASYGAYNYISSSVMTDVTLFASGGTNSHNRGIENDHSSPTMTNVIASAIGQSDGDNIGVLNHYSSPAMTNVIASAFGGTGTANNGVNNYVSSPAMTNVTASASGGRLNYGISNDSGSPTIVSTTASASNGTEINYGVLNAFSSVTMTNVTASAFGGTASINCGIQNGESSLTMTNVTASASGGAQNYGMVNSQNPWGNPYTILIDRSSFSGSTNSISNSAGAILKIGASKLTGPADTFGTYKCVSSYNGDTYAPLNESCQ